MLSEVEACNAKDYSSTSLGMTCRSNYSDENE